MITKRSTLIPNLTHEVVSNIKGFKLDAYLIALEGWRRGLKLKWYKDESELCKIAKIPNMQGKFFSLHSESNTHYFVASRGDFVSKKAVKYCKQKDQTNNMLREKGVPIPEGKEFNINSITEMIDFAESIGFPVVLKPVNGSMGKGVYTNLFDQDQLKNAISEAKVTYKNFNKYLIEKHYAGDEFRVFVVGDKVVAVTHRIPAHVTGDGKNSIKALIELKNESRKENPYLVTKPIKVDFEVHKLLKKVGYDLNSIPKKEEKVSLREKSNLSQGGEHIDATDILSEEVKQIAVDALKAIPSLPQAGVDVIIDSNSVKEGVVLEVNATPEIVGHSFPVKGQARDVAGAIIDYYFPESIGNEKSDFYFDYQSILEPLKTWTTEEITVTKAPTGFIYGKKYIVSGKVERVGYMNWIRRQALKNNLFGYTKKAGKNKLEVIVIGKDEIVVDSFIELCMKGSRNSRVDHVEEQEFEIKTGQPFKIGFELKL